jgi:hypothetical protein
VAHPLSPSLHRIIFILCWGAASALPLVSPAPVAAQATVVTPEVAQKIERARQRGYWVIEEGDHLYRISRYFVPGIVQVKALAKELEVLNPNALIYGDPTRLVVGARLFLPKRLLEDSAQSPPAAVAAPGSAQSPPAAVAAPGPARAAPLAPPAPAAKQAPLTAPIAPSVASAPAVQAPAAPQPAPYVDRLMAGAPSAEEEAREDAMQADASPGLKSMAAELRTEHRDVTGVGKSDTQALRLRLSRETESWGDFTLEAQAAHVHGAQDGTGEQHTRGSATLYHDNFALTRDFIASSALGVIRPSLPNWLSTSYRVLIAPSLLEGASTTIASPTQEFRVAAGQLGRYAGTAIQDFERTSGSQASASYSQRLGNDWQVGGAAITMHGSDSVSDHTAASLAVQRGLSPTGDGVKLQAAMTNSGDGAAWLDAQTRSGRLTQRFGAYYADPDFRFGENATTRDVRGVYWRGDYRVTGDFYGAGVEAVQENLRRDPARGGTESLGLFGNMSLRLDRNTQVGGGLALRDENARVPTGIDRQTGTVNAFVSHRWDLGQSRLDWNLYQSRPTSLPSERTQTANWNQDWPLLFGIDISTLIGFSDEHLMDRHTKRRLASLGLRGPIWGNVRWNTTVTAVDVDQPPSSERNYNATAGIDWNIAPEWTLQLYWYRNQIQPGPDNGLLPFSRENTVQLNVRYESAYGAPYPRVGGAGGRSGAGTIVGSVFFDENSDGLRGPNERGAPGVVLILDERQSVVTDNEGRFRFGLVPAGRHRVRIVVERVALPWGLEDESPRELAVDVRADARLDVGLTRIAP